MVVVQYLSDEKIATKSRAGQIIQPKKREQVLINGKNS